MAALDVFISLRFGEAMPEAEALKAGLIQAGLTVYLCAVQEGGNIAVEISKAIDSAKLVVILGTPTYGQETSASFSTHQELLFIMNEKKPFFLIKLCDRFEDSLTRFYLNDSVSYFPWKPLSAKERSSVPPELLSRILDKLNAVAVTGVKTHKTLPNAESTSRHSAAVETLATCQLQPREQRLAEQAAEDERRKEEEAERERQMSEQLAALQLQIEELQRAKEEEARQQRELHEAATKAMEEERKCMMEMEQQLEMERLLRAKLKAEEEAAAASAEAAAAVELSMAEVDELRKKKECEHEERKRENELALEQSRQDHARQEAEATRIREEFKAQEAERERVAREREETIKRDKEQLQKEYERRLEQLRAAHDKLQAKGSSRMQFSEIWEIRVSEYKHRGDNYVFRIDMSLLGEKWSIWRRFSHFKDLHRLMKSKMKNVASHVPFPPEHRMTTSLKKSQQLSDEFLRQRAKHLEIYLNELVQKSFRNAASPFYEVDRGVLERSFAFFRKGGLSQ